MRGNEKGERQRSRKKEVMKEKERNEDRERVVVYKYMSIEWVHSGRKEERRKRGIREVCRRDHSFPTFLFSFPSISPHHSVSLPLLSIHPNHKSNLMKILTRIWSPLTGHRNVPVYQNLQTKREVVETVGGNLKISAPLTNTTFFFFISISFFSPLKI